VRRLRVCGLCGLRNECAGSCIGARIAHCAENRAQALLELEVRCARPLFRLVVRALYPREERCNAVVVVVVVKTRTADARLEEVKCVGVLLGQAIRVSDQRVVLVRDLLTREVVSALLMRTLVFHPLVDVRGEDVEAFVDVPSQRLKFSESAGGVEIAGAARALGIMRIVLRRVCAITFRIIAPALIAKIAAAPIAIAIAVVVVVRAMIGLVENRVLRRRPVAQRIGACGQLRRRCENGSGESAGCDASGR
jgi:hypothetical protein